MQYLPNITPHCRPVPGRVAFLTPACWWTGGGDIVCLSHWVVVQVQHDGGPALQDQRHAGHAREPGSVPCTSYCGPYSGVQVNRDLGMFLCCLSVVGSHNTETSRACRSTMLHYRSVQRSGPQYCLGFNQIAYCVVDCTGDLHSYVDVSS